jgi:DNA mismatch repair protein MutS2
MNFFDKLTSQSLEWENLIENIVKFAKLRTTKNKFRSEKGLSLDERKFWHSAVQMLQKDDVRRCPSVPSSLNEHDLDKCYHSVCQVSLHKDEDFSAWRDALSFHADLQTYLKSYSLFFDRFRSPSLKIIAQAYDLLFDARGQIKDNASENLFKIRDRIRTEKKHQAQEIKQWMKKKSVQKQIQDQHIYIESQTCLVALKSSAQSLFEGTVFSLSHSGQTVFFEPEEIKKYRLNLIELLAKEKKEEQKLKKEWVQKLKENEDIIEKGHQVIQKADELMTRLTWAEHSQGTGLQWTSHSTPHLVIDEMFHPLTLFENFSAKPVSFSLKSPEKGAALIISGPNAGGKTFFLKTLGLNLLLSANGFYSCLKGGLCSEFFCCVANIGDQQSIADDLSSFTGFVKGLKDSLKKTTQPSCFLFDELFASTEPRSAEALSASLIKYLMKGNHLVILTTHLEPIKLLLKNNIYQASFAYNLESLTPTYELVWNQPGLSYAFEVAEGVGLDKEILQEAKNHLNQNNQKTTSWENWTKKLQEWENRLLRDEQTIKSEQLKWKNEQEFEIQKEKKALLLEKEKWQKKENKLVHELKLYEKRKRKEIEETLEKWFKNKKREKKEVEAPIISVEQPYLKNTLEENIELPIGQTVFSQKMKKKGKVIKKKQDKYLVAFGVLKTICEGSDLEKIEETRSQKNHMEPKKTNFFQQEEERCELIGFRSKDALSELDQSLDRAYQAGQSRLIVVHGHGTGELKRAIRKFLSQFKRFPISYEDGDWSEGNGAVTIVLLDQET